MCVLLLFSHSVVSDSLQPRGLCVTGIKWVLARDTAEHPTVHGTAPQYRELMIQPEVNCVQVEKPWFRPWWLVRSLKLLYMYSLNSHDNVGFICAKLHSRVRLCDPMDCSPPGSSVHGIFQVRILEWVATPFSRGSSWPRLNSGLLHCRWILYHLSHQGSFFQLRWNSHNVIFKWIVRLHLVHL